jgi:hypothetical protein
MSAFLPVKHMILIIFMIFITAQPDEDYFLWQLEVQYYNFQKSGIPFTCIHTLLGYDEYPRKEAIAFQEKYQALGIRIFFYPDEREIGRVYIPSIRPHLLKKYFRDQEKYEAIFYHDADIIFNTLPNFELLQKDTDWYASDMRFYLSAAYCKRKGQELFQGMCEIVGVDPKMVEGNNENAGGAQYLLKGDALNYAFWDKVEEDSTNLYLYTKTSVPYFRQQYVQLTGKEDYEPIQFWCADMWALLWNGLLNGNNIKITPELNFSWPLNPIEDFYRNPIYHNAGVTEKEKKHLFYKANYLHKTPWEEELTHVDKAYCSYKYVQCIKEAELWRKSI